jgi:soluble lytic murein transglycosylase-like protein
MGIRVSFAVLATGLASLLIAPWVCPARAQSGETVNAARHHAGAPALQREARLPALLSGEDAERCRRIFALQEDGQWAAADDEIQGLRDPLLLGHVLAQRYLHPTLYRSSYGELRDWLAEFADHPDAGRIYRLAWKRKPRKARAPRAPVGEGYLNGVGADLGLKTGPPYRSAKPRTKEEAARVRQLEARIRARVRQGWPTGALELLEADDAARLLDEVEYDRARATIAAGYFAYNKDEKALMQSAAAAKRSGERVPTAHWTAGLAAWRLGRVDAAAAHFEALARSKSASDWKVAAGAYWAARAHLVARRPAKVSRWLRLAAGYPRTFYGLLAHRALGTKPPLDWTVPGLGDGDVARLMTIPAVTRTLALVQVGQHHRAEAELRKLYAGADPWLADKILALAVRGNLPGLAMRIGVKLAEDEGRHLDAAIYPVPAWQPEDGFRVDRALLYAIMRQESRFVARARSAAGASGLMQIMPRTANFISEGDPLRGETRKRLFEPELNIALGQKYLDHLLGDEMVRGNLFLLAAAYNGGPGKLAKWRRRIAYGGDALLFIESIPSRETRDFIERMLASFWIYRQELGQPTPSLDAIAAGDWPNYIALDAVTKGSGNYGQD